MTTLATVGELADFLELPTPSAETDEHRRGELLLSITSGLVLSYLNRPSLDATEATGLIDGSGSAVLLLPADHLVDVIEVVEDPRGEATTLVEDIDFDWNRDGILTRQGGHVWRLRSRWYEVTISYGLSDDEKAQVKLVVLRVAARALVNPEGLATESMGGYVSGFAFDETRLPTLARPDQADLDRVAVTHGASGIFEAAGS